MGDEPRVGGLDQRYAPWRAGRFHARILLAGVLLGAGAGIAFAAASVPDPNCAAEDGMCKLQRVYLAQGVKLAAGMLLGFLLAEALAIRIPNALAERRRRQARELELARRPPVTPPKPFDAALARAALDAVGRSASLPPAALRALEAAGGEPAAPAPDAARARSAAARETLGAMARSPGLPPAALEALLRQGPALGGGPRRPPSEPSADERPAGDEPAGDRRGAAEGEAPGD